MYRLEHACLKIRFSVLHIDYHADQREQGMVDSMYGGFFDDEPLNCGIFFGVSPCLLPTHRGYGSLAPHTLIIIGQSQA